MKKRKNNIELLRIISMIMILFLHLLRFGGLLDTTSVLSLKFILCWLIESFCFVAVNVYVLISGYFLLDSKFKFTKLIKLWFEVFVYSIVIYAISIFFGNNAFTLIGFLKSIFPIIFGNYWFVSVYFLLYLLSPILNKFVMSLSKKQYKYLLIIVCIFFSVLPLIIPQVDTINFGGSYSISWFIVLYFVAGYIKLFCQDKYNSKKICLAAYIACSIFNLIFLVVTSVIKIPFIETSVFYNYFSITVLIGAVCLFKIFLNIKIKSDLINKLISLFAPTTFGIYLIHENPNFRIILWNFFNWINDFGVLEIIYLFLTPFVLFIIFGLIDKIRVLIFNKLINKLICYIEKNKFIKKVEGELYEN